MSSTNPTRRRTKKNGFRSSPPLGILRPEMFAMKSMDRNSSLLKLKLDLVYRDLAIEEAQTRFNELNTEVVVERPVEQVKNRRMIKALVPGKRTMPDDAKTALLERTKKAAQPPKAVLPAAK